MPIRVRLPASALGGPIVGQKLRLCRFRVLGLEGCCVSWMWLLEKALPWISQRIAQRFTAEDWALLRAIGKWNTLTLARADDGMFIAASDEVTDQADLAVFQRRLAAMEKLGRAGYLVHENGQPVGTLGNYHLTPQAHRLLAKKGPNKRPNQ